MFVHPLFNLSSSQPYVLDAISAIIFQMRKQNLRETKYHGQVHPALELGSELGCEWQQASSHLRSGPRTMPPPAIAAAKKLLSSQTTRSESASWPENHNVAQEPKSNCHRQMKPGPDVSSHLGILD